MRGDVLDPIDNRNGVGVATLLEDRQINRSLTVDPHNVVLNLVSIFGVAHVLDVDRRLTNDFQRHIVDVVDRVELTVGIDVVIDRPDRHITGW